MPMSFIVSTMRILGIDPGLHFTGYGCVDLSENCINPSLVEGGVLRLASKRPMAERLQQLHEDLLQVIDELQPQQIVVEKIFSHYKHVRTAMLMGHARGVVLLTGQMRGLEFFELAPTEIKKAITGNGHATKLQMQHAVMVQFDLAEMPNPPDVADAIAIALCAARRHATNALTTI